jgi:hypothetical protein
MTEAVVQPQEDCQQCKGRGGHYAMLTNHGDHTVTLQYVQCLHPTCNRGKVDPALSEAYHASWRI